MVDRLFDAVAPQIDGPKFECTGADIFDRVVQKMRADRAAGVDIFADPASDDQPYVSVTIQPLES